MLKACKYCGRIHDSHFDCGRRPTYQKRTKEAEHIRSTSRWQKLRAYIRRRDEGLCQLCLINYEGTRRTCEYENLSIHHIEPLEEDESRAYDEDNLITLCDIHHEAAEAGRVPRQFLHQIAIKNNKKS